MDNKINIFCFFTITFFIYMSDFATAATIGVSPGILNFPSMIKSGYAQSNILVSTSSKETLEGHFEIEGEIKDWISIVPANEKFNVSSANPYLFTIIINPPTDAKNGNYSGTFTILTDQVISLESGAGTAIIAAVAVKINVEIIGDEIILCRAGAFSVTDAEIDEPIYVGGTVYNDGNVRLRPEFQVAIYRPLDDTPLFETSFLGEQILPTLNKRITKDVDAKLTTGQYYIDIRAKECSQGVTLSFDVVEKGGIADRGVFIGIRANEFSYAGDLTKVSSLFKNEGVRAVRARFVGEVTSLDSKRILTALESDEIDVEPGRTVDFATYFTPQDTGKYQIAGRVYYNKKVSFDQASKVINVVKKDSLFKPGSLVLIIIYLIIGISILILIGKIKKSRKHKSKF
ncbi:MAG: hypothetical protein V1859_04475 [archaeon]